MNLQSIHPIDRANTVTWFGKYPWRRVRRSNRHLKAYKNRAERRRAKCDPECVPCYNRFNGYMN